MAKLLVFPQCPSPFPVTSVCVWRAEEGTGDIPPAPTSRDRSGGDGQGSLALVGPSVPWSPQGEFYVLCGHFTHGVIGCCGVVRAMVSTAAGLVVWSASDQPAR